MLRPVPALAAAALVALAGLLACEKEPPKTALGYSEGAKREYEAAMEQFRAHAWIDAQAQMREVKRRYSYSKYARLAELRIADADYEQDKFAEAIREYKEFIHAHRSDAEDVAYARSRMAEATYAEIPESILMPAAEERDQAAVVDSYKELRSYLADYPDSKQSTHIRELLAQVTARLVRHELYVAHFYLNKENFEAAVARIQYALRTYAIGKPGSQTGAASDLEGDALLLLGETYLKMHKWGEAREAFDGIVRGFDGRPVATQARNYLAHLRMRGV
ncbi:MAG: outer membrane protein assembly factor BamD [Myxococcota bacterium]|nr:outer membrane protein assembly factor BamD [Myxococcota bacterium]